MIAILLVGIFLVCSLLGMPLAFSFGVAATVACLVGDIPLQVIAQRLMIGINSFAFIAVPGFVLVGEIMTRGGVSRRLVNFSNSVVGHFKGGLSMATVFAGMIMGGISGSAVADTAALGGALIPTMEKEKYPRDFSAAVIAASGSLGIIIPPSIPMIIYSQTADLSLLNLFLAGYFPGIAMGIFMMYFCYVISKKRDYGRTITQFSWKNLGATFKESILALITPLIIVGGILTGIFTPTESSIIGVVYALVISIFGYRELRWREMIRVLLDSVKTTARVMFILASASVFSYISINEGIPDLFVKFIFSISASKAVILILVNLIFLFVGCIIDILAAIVIFVPVLVPLGEALHMDQLHLAMIFIVNMSIGLLTPPVGFSIFVSSAIAGVPLERTAYRAIPMMIAMAIVLVIVNIFPQFVLFVPNLFR
jgi:C4-dicarboxylate transporter DctM subunit